MYIPPELSDLKNPLCTTIVLSQNQEMVKTPNEVRLSKPETVIQALNARYNEDYLALKNFLESLPDDVLIGMVTVMYIGSECQGQEISNKEMFYKSYYKNYGEWNRKNAIWTMTSKANLYQYLQTGMQLLF
ncbi:MAG: hypothetical protein ABFC57_04430 [Veillonellales bacterium]